MKELMLSIILIGLAIVLLGIKVLFIKGSKFPSGHVHQNEALRNKGISCASEEANSLPRK
jgi:hypothetical protein